MEWLISPKIEISCEELHEDRSLLDYIIFILDVSTDILIVTILYIYIFFFFFG